MKKLIFCSILCLFSIILCSCEGESAYTPHRVTVIDTRNQTILFELTGICYVYAGNDYIEIDCKADDQVTPLEYKVSLTDFTVYVVEELDASEISGYDIDVYVLPKQDDPTLVN